MGGMVVGANAPDVDGVTASKTRLSEVTSKNGWERDKDGGEDHDALLADSQYVYAVTEDIDITPGQRIPLTLAEALAGPDGPKWRAALGDEIRSLNENDVFEVVPIPAGVVPVTSKPVMTIKTNEHGEVVRYKVRIVARGFTQVKGVDFSETFSPVANLESIRIIVALAAMFDLELDQMDVKTAYLNGILQETIYLRPPEGVPIRPGYCWRLKRSLYGLKQSGRTWNRTLDQNLLDMGFVRLDAETCLYVYRKGKEVCFLVVYVDDLLLAATSRHYMDNVKSMLSGRFKMEDMGEAKYILGIRIRRDRPNRAIYLSQENYTCVVADALHGMLRVRPHFYRGRRSSYGHASDTRGKEALRLYCGEVFRTVLEQFLGCQWYRLGSRFTHHILGTHMLRIKGCPTPEACSIVDTVSS
ncbi:hypothetical protein NMY22_g1838 [Coprinellus aureogranulatus]|nr:hypothetical protein NMY22_g1838 [Coprinellus aureogranulatus]